VRAISPQRRWPFENERSAVAGVPELGEGHRQLTFSFPSYDARGRGTKMRNISAGFSKASW